MHINKKINLLDICEQDYKYSRIPISRTSKGNENWFEKSAEVRNIGVDSETNSRETNFGSSYRGFSEMRVQEIVIPL